MPLVYLNTVFLLVLASCTVCSLLQLCSVRAPESRRTLIRLLLQSNYLPGILKFPFYSFFVSLVAFQKTE